VKTVAKRIGKWTGIVLSTLVATAAATYPIADWSREPMDDAARAELLSEGKAANFVTTSQGVMHVRLSGPASGPVVLLVHGGVVGGYGFENWRKPLADAGYRVIVPDLLGYGYSDRPDVPYDKDFYNRQLTEMLAGLRIAEPVDIVGASFGGALVTAFAQVHPERVRSVVLLSPAGLGRTQLTNPALMWPVVGDWVFRVFGPSTLEGMMEKSYENTPGRDGMLAWMAEQAKYRGFAEGVLKSLRDYDSEWQPDAYDALGRTTLPVLAVWGTADTVHPFSFTAALERRVPQVELVALHGKGHAITFGETETVLGHVLPFLREFGSDPDDA
jgi:pimeloyl-ACP methyl ester carboxylesterase